MRYDMIVVEESKKEQRYSYGFMDPSDWFDKEPGDPLPPYKIEPIYKILASFEILSHPFFIIPLLISLMIVTCFLTKGKFVPFSFLLGFMMFIGIRMGGYDDDDEEY